MVLLGLLLVIRYPLSVIRYPFCVCKNHGISSSFPMYLKCGRNSIRYVTYELMRDRFPRETPTVSLSVIRYPLFVLCVLESWNFFFVPYESHVRPEFHTLPIAIGSELCVKA